jgi:hypothetical protein
MGFVNEAVCAHIHPMAFDRGVRRSAVSTCIACRYGCMLRKCAGLQQCLHTGAVPIVMSRCLLCSCHLCITSASCVVSAAGQLLISQPANHVQ